MNTSTIAASLLLCCYLATAPLQAGIAGNPARQALPAPSVEMQPQDVVRVVIDALADNDRPHRNAGIETTFAFASPANKANTGPLERFTRMVRGEPYGVMVDHVDSEFSEVVLTGVTAYQMVRLTGRDGREVIFAFRLSRQSDGEFADMWMTDAVWPVATVESGQGF